MTLKALIASTTARITGLNSTAFQLEAFPSYSVIGAVLNQTPAAIAGIAADTAVSPTTEEITYTAHGLKTGLKVRVAADGGGSLPTGLAAATDYFVISTGANTFQLAASLANALASTPVPVNITADGSGTFTLTPTAIAGSLKLQASNDGTNWADISGASVSISGDASLIYEKASAQYRFVRAALSLTAGAADVEVSLFARASSVS
jgi:hypothetical protein